jgi:hypothetical protein
MNFKIDPEFYPYLIVIGLVMAATGALQMWLVFALLWTS